MKKLPLKAGFRFLLGRSFHVLNSHGFAVKHVPFVLQTFLSTNSLGTIQGRLISCTYKL